MTGKLGADKLLLAMEKQTIKYFDNKKVEQIVRWAEAATEGSIGKAPPSAKKAASIFLALALDTSYYCEIDALDDDIAIEHYTDLARFSSLVISQKLGANFDIFRDFSHQLNLRLDYDFAQGIANIGIFSDTDFDSLMQGTARVTRDQPKESATHTEKIQHIEKLYQFWFSAFRIKSKHYVLFGNNSKSLANYLYVYELIICCKEGAMRVSPDVWAGIESRILTVPVASEATPD